MRIDVLFREAKNKRFPLSSARFERLIKLEVDNSRNAFGLMIDISQSLQILGFALQHRAYSRQEVESIVRYCVSVLQRYATDVQNNTILMTNICVFASKNPAFSDILRPIIPNITRGLANENNHSQFKPVQINLILTAYAKYNYHIELSEINSVLAKVLSRANAIEISGILKSLYQMNCKDLNSISDSLFYAIWRLPNWSSQKCVSSIIYYIAKLNIDLTKSHQDILERFVNDIIPNADNVAIANILYAVSKKKLVGCDLETLYQKANDYAFNMRAEELTRTLNAIGSLPKLSKGFPPNLFPAVLKSRCVGRIDEEQCIDLLYGYMRVEYLYGLPREEINTLRQFGLDYAKELNISSKIHIWYCLSQICTIEIDHKVVAECLKSHLGLSSNLLLKGFRLLASQHATKEVLTACFSYVCNRLRTFSFSELNELLLSTASMEIDKCMIARFSDDFVAAFERGAKNAGPREFVQTVHILSEWDINLNKASNEIQRTAKYLIPRFNHQDIANFLYAAKRQNVNVSAIVPMIWNQISNLMTTKDGFLPIHLPMMFSMLPELDHYELREMRDDIVYRLCKEHMGALDSKAFVNILSALVITPKVQRTLIEMFIAHANELQEYYNITNMAYLLSSLNKIGYPIDRFVDCAIKVVDATNITNKYCLDVILVLAEQSEKSQSYLKQRLLSEIPQVAKLHPLSVLDFVRALRLCNVYLNNRDLEKLHSGVYQVRENMAQVFSLMNVLNLHYSLIVLGIQPKLNDFLLSTLLLENKQKLDYKAELQLRTIRCYYEVYESKEEASKIPVSKELSSIKGKASAMQKQIQAAIKRQYPQFTIEEEQCIGPFSVDMLISDLRTVIEVNGPHHYDLEGRTNLHFLFKKAMLEKMGYEVIVIKTDDWLRNSQQLPLAVIKKLTSRKRSSNFLLPTRPKACMNAQNIQAQKHYNPAHVPKRGRR